MSGDRVATLVIFIGVAALFYLVAVPLVRRRIKPNGFYGLRVPATFADESVWYDANEAFGRDMRWLAIGCLVLAVVGFIAPMSDDVYSLGMALALVVAVLTVAIVAWRRANRMLRARRAG